MTVHPFVTIYKSDDGRWKAAYTDPATRKLLVRVFRDHGVLTAQGRLEWAKAKSDALRAECFARASV